jgi:hypothetical protein
MFMMAKPSASNWSVSFETLYELVTPLLRQLVEILCRLNAFWLVRIETYCRQLPLERLEGPLRLFKLFLQLIQLLSCRPASRRSRL